MFTLPRKPTVRPKTGGAPLVKSLDTPVQPAPTPAEAKPSGPAISVAEALRKLARAVAPANIATALGLAPGATNSEVIAANLIAKCSASDVDASTVKALLDRLQEIEPREPVQISVRYVNEDEHAQLRALAPAILLREPHQRLWEYLDWQLRLHNARVYEEAKQLIANASEEERRQLIGKMEKDLATIGALGAKPKQFIN